MISFGTSWSYTLPAVYVYHTWSGYATATWEHEYQFNSGAAESSYEYDPGMVISNNFGNLVVPIDDKISFWYYLTQGWNDDPHPDNYDTLYVSALPGCEPA